MHILRGWSGLLGAMDDKLRAAVYARDKGICAFSGLSLWLLDYCTAPFAHYDWADHIKPRSRGGSDTINNLVCASFFHNRKKLNNGSDVQYLFKGGRPTELFFWTHGEISLEQSRLLSRNQALGESDWYFNRAVFNFLIALDNEYRRATVSRDKSYWLASAWKRLTNWRKLDGRGSSFAERGLLRFPKAADTKLILSLADAREQDLPKIFKLLASHYRANNTVLDRFLRAPTAEGRIAILQNAKNSGRATEPLLATLRNNVSRLDVSLGALG